MMVKKKKEKLFDFAKFISEFYQLPKAERTIDVYDYKAKVEEIKKIQERYIHISLFKMSDKISTRKAFIDGREPINIEMNPDEYLGSDVHMIYDTHNRVLMVQRTRESLSISTISAYFNEFAHKLSALHDDQVLEIQPIYDNKVLTACSRVKKIDLRFANIENVNLPEGTGLSQMLNFFNRFRGISGSVTIGIGRSSKKTTRLDNGEINNTVTALKELKKNYNTCISSARISYTENDTSFLYDLFDDILNDIGEIDIIPRIPLNFIEIENLMLRLYNKKVPYINNVIKYKG